MRMTAAEFFHGVRRQCREPIQALEWRGVRSPLRLKCYECTTFQCKHKNRRVCIVSDKESVWSLKHEYDHPRRPASPTLLGI